jgi:hypothetical protein
MRRVMTAAELGAWCADGRWGPRRARTTECWARLDAETAYDGLLRDAPLTLRPGARGDLTWYLGARSLSVPWELRANHVGRPVRLLLRCPRCERLVSRVFLPTVDAHAAACRSCWGLSYESRQRNYREVGLLRPWLTSRDFARRETAIRREATRRAARERAERRRDLRRRLVASA